MEQEKPQEQGDIFEISQETVNQFLQPLVPLPNFERKGKPYFAIYPSRMHMSDVIVEEIERNGIQIEEERVIPKFEDFARYIYPIDYAKPHSYLWLPACRQLYQNLPDIGIAYVLNKEAEVTDYFNKLKSLKRSIRRTLKPFALTAVFEGTQFPIHIHHIHLPEEEEIDQQYNTLLNFSSSHWSP